MEFNEYTATIVQLISFPLEAIGLLMVLIEIYKPKLADRIETGIDRYYENYWMIKHSYFFSNLTDIIDDQFYWDFEETEGRPAAHFFKMQLPLIIYILLYGYFMYTFYTETGVKGFRLFLLLLFLLVVGFVLGYIIFFISRLIIAIIVTFIIVVFGGLLFLLFSAILFLPLFVLKWLFLIFDYIGKGHAMGGIGFALSLLGLIGELYQVATIFWGN